MVSKERIKELAASLLLEPTEDVIELTKTMLASIDKQLFELEVINLDDIKPLLHVNEEEIAFASLRDDIVDDTNKINKENILKNAAEANSDYVIMKRVVNEE